MNWPRLSAGPGRIVVAVAAFLLPLQPLALGADDPGALHGEYVVDVVELDNGDAIVAHVFPSPPPDPDELPAAPVIERTSAAGVTLNGVPAFDWCYGCSATSAAMLFGYYDRHGFPEMYDGPANDGVCPLTNSTWGYGESPLSATHQGFDGLAARGHVDDYFSAENSTVDPYYGNWPEHGYADCAADFMGTSQHWNWDNVDGGTTFFYYTNNSPLHDYSGSESSGLRDGMHGMRLFAESRGYTVVANYNQYIYGYGGASAGFTWTQYKTEIDAGRPVLIQIAGHTMLGVGYDDPNTVYVHDTWDHSMHAMTWGGSYAGRNHYAVGVLVLEQDLDVPLARTDAATSVEESSATLNGTVVDDGGESCEYRFRYGMSPGSYTVVTSWTGSLLSGQDFSVSLSGLDPGLAYYYVAELRNSSGDSSGEEAQFTTKPGAPSALSASTLGVDSIGLSWTQGDGAATTRVQRSTGAYPSALDAGTTVYDGSGTSLTDTVLEPDTTYYYRAWSAAAGGAQWSDSYSQAAATTDGVLPLVSTQAASDVASTGALVHGTIVDDRGEACQYRFEYDTSTGAPYSFSTAWTGAVGTGESFDATLAALAPGTEYWYRAQARNSAGEASGLEQSFTTLPEAPTGLAATPAGEHEINLAWTVGNGATSTCIVRKLGGYPADRNDGVQVYLDGGTLYVDTGLTPGTTYWYRAWAFDAGAEQWSEDYTEASAATTSDGVPALEVSPAGFEVQLPPGTTVEYDLTLSNTGDGVLSYTVADAVAPAAPAPSGSEADLIHPDSQRVKTANVVVPPGVDEIIVKMKDDARASSPGLHRSMGVIAAGRGGSGRFDLVRVAESGDVAALIQDYLASGLVEYAEPNYPRLAAWAPDDPSYSRQWHFDAVNAEGAWDVQRGGAPDVTVAVLDTGVAYETYDVFTQAPDLAGTLFASGWDFVNSDAHPNDDNGHGTHVCGTIAQTTDNGSGVAGLAFGVTILPVKVLDAAGSGTVATVADGIYYAVDHGAHVINLSLSGAGTSQTEADAVAYAHEHGVVVVCAAGNDYASGNDPQYPAAYASTIAVGATRYDDARAWYSNTGSYLDIVAPGGDLSVDQNGDTYPDGVLQQTLSGGYGSFDYRYYQGTSMACPHVSAVAALLLSENRSLGVVDIRSTLQGTATDLGVVGWDDVYGHGLLNAAAALSGVAGASWLSQSPSEGTIAPSGSTVVTVTVDTDGLADGDYSAIIITSSNDPVAPVVETPFTLHVRTITSPVVVTGPATEVTGQAATIGGTVQHDGWEACEYSFEYGLQAGGPYEETAWSGSLASGESFSHGLASLDRGSTWFFRARARNSAGTGHGAELSFTTLPGAPVALTAAPDEHLPFYRIDLSWTAGDGAGRTHVRVKQGAYPSDPSDGALVYEGDSTTLAHSGLQPSTLYYYRAWSIVQDASGQDVWSDAFAEASATTADEPSTVSLSLDLQPGWNMVSVPLYLPDMSIGSVFAGAAAVYGWNSSLKAYVVPGELDPSAGYWVAVAAARTIDYTGVPVTGWSVALSPGWHLAGSVHGGLVDFSQPSDEPDGSVGAFAYLWNPLTKSYSYTQTVEPGRAHWLAVGHECELTVEYAG